MGLFKKTAIIIAAKKIATDMKTSSEKQKVENLELEEPIEKNASKEETSKNTNITEKIKPKIELKEDAIIDNFFTNDKNDSTKVESEKLETKTVSTAEIAFEDDRDTPENRELSIEIEKKMQNLMKAACFEVDTVEVDVFNGIAHIFIDGDDAALLIGKEGYRYNALSYMLFNWINAQYNLYIKLEIAEFIQAQEEMIDSYLKPIAEHIKEHGKGKTKPLDGILVQIALEKLRAMFSNKYIAIKTGKDGKKFIIINDFNTRKN
jgi:spoIIIJ-associated protein